MMIIKKILSRLFRIKKVVQLNITYTLPTERFKGRRVLVTGGSSGIGKAIAKAFLNEGAQVIICARSRIALLETQREMGTKNIFILPWDISETEKIPSKLAEAQQLLPNIDTYINAAGVSAYNENAMTEKMYDYICGINQKALFFMNFHQGNLMIEQGIQGKIINITSKAGERIGFDPYLLSKWGANSITKGLARRLAPHHINVNGIAPGRVPTNITAELQSHINSGNAYTPRHATQRFTMPEEVAAAALFLASGEANNIVGQIINIDGGIYD